MKVATLLAQYLYTTRRLDLPGIGSFTLDSPAVIETDPKHGKAPVLEGVSFTENPSVKDDDGFTAFVSTHTGKMKALAAADIDSYLTLAKQFLNIGKPFLIEGVGTLVKTRSGLEFTPGMMVTEKLKETPVIKDPAQAGQVEESFSGYEDVFTNSTTSSRNRKRKLLLGSLTIAGLLLAIAGGFYIARTMKNNGEAAASQTETAGQPETTAVKDTMPQKDSPVTTPAVTAPVPAGSYKFVIEEAGKDRAIKRFTRLKNAGHAVQLETKDSVNFKLFYVLQVSAADTARILDSFTNNYPALNKKRAYIE